MTSQYLFQICIIVRLLTWLLSCQMFLPLLSLVELSQTVFDGLGQINIHLGEDFYSQVNISCQQNILCRSLTDSSFLQRRDSLA